MNKINLTSYLTRTSLLAFCILFSFNTQSKAVKETPQKAKNVNVLFKTTSGNIVIELYPNEAPITVANFLRYIDEGFYDGTIFHRVVPGFVVQGGGFSYDFQRRKTNDPIKNESDNTLKNLKGTLSMARTGRVDSATSQFFINLNNNTPLDFNNGKHGYAVFGKVIKGFKHVLKIEKEPRGIHRSHPEAPNNAVIVEKASRLK